MKIKALPALLIAGCFSTSLLADVDTESTEIEQPPAPGSTFECTYHSSEIPSDFVKLVVLHGAPGCGLDQGSYESRVKAVKSYIQTSNIDSSMQVSKPMNCNPLTQPEHGMTNNQTYYQGVLDFIEPLKMAEPFIPENEEDKVALQTKATSYVGELDWAAIPYTKCQYAYVKEPHIWPHSGGIKRIARPLLITIPAGIVGAITGAISGSSTLRTLSEKGYGVFVSDLKTWGVTAATTLLTAFGVYKLTATETPAKQKTK